MHQYMPSAGDTGETKNEWKRTTYRAFHFLRMAAQMPIRRVCRELNVDNATVMDWENGVADPPRTVLIGLSIYIENMRGRITRMRDHYARANSELGLSIPVVAFQDETETKREGYKTLRAGEVCTGETISALIRSGIPVERIDLIGYRDFLATNAEQGSETGCNKG